MVKSVHGIKKVGSHCTRTSAKYDSCRPDNCLHYVQLTKTTANRITASVMRTYERNHLQLRFRESVLQLAVGLVVTCIVRSCPDTLLHTSLYLLRIFFMSSLPQQSRACTAGHVSNHKIHCYKPDAGRLFSSSAFGGNNRSKQFTASHIFGPKLTRYTA